MRQKLGQHFLRDGRIQRLIASRVMSYNVPNILEVGPGYGSLTIPVLAKLKTQFPKRGEFYAIEKDPSLATKLGERFVDKTRELQKCLMLCGDAREFIRKIASRFQKNRREYVIFGSIPYYLTGHLLRVIGELAHRPARCLFVMQREVAERIIAQPPRMNLLAASIQCWARPTILSNIKRNAFSPAPRVASSLIELATLPQNEIVSNRAFYTLIRNAFRQPRKTIFNNLRAAWSKSSVAYALQNAGVAENARPHALPLEKFVVLSSLLQGKR